MLFGILRITYVLPDKLPDAPYPPRNSGSFSTVVYTPCSSGFLITVFVESCPASTAENNSNGIKNIFFHL